MQNLLLVLNITSYVVLIFCGIQAMKFVYGVQAIKIVYSIFKSQKLSVK